MENTNVFSCVNNERIKLVHYGDIFSSLTTYNIKLEDIVSCSGDVLGYEILLDFESAKKDGDWVLKEYKKSIYDTSAIDFTIKKIISNKMRLNVERIFLNFERMHLCNYLLLQRMVLFSKELFLRDIELVLEITERNECNNCQQIYFGLSFLKRMGVVLAIDDLDIYGNDFRMSEVLAGMYDYIKIEMPVNEHQRSQFNRFSIDFKIGKIILEKVADLEEMNGLVKPFGLQGFFKS